MTEFEKNNILKKRNLGTIGLEVLLLIVSAFIFSLAFPGPVLKNGLGFLAFVALIPLFAVIHNTSFKIVGLYGFFYGFVFYWFFNYWLAAFHPLANLLVQCIKASEMFFLFLALKAADRFFSKKINYVFQAIIWVAYAYLSQNWFAGYPYGTIAYALFRYRILIQIADLSGIWGITFMMILPQAFFGQYLCRRFSKTRDVRYESLRSLILGNKFVIIIYIALLSFQIVYGGISCMKWGKAEQTSSFRVATVQHNHDSWKGGYDTYEKNFHDLSRLSLEAMQKNPDLIVWSETAFVPSVNWYTNYPYKGNDDGEVYDYLRKIQGLVDEFITFCSNLGRPLLTGNPCGVIKPGASSPYTTEGDWNKIEYNSVILFDNGKVQDSYFKQHLVPFTEHFPYEKQMPLLYKILVANDYHWWEEGKESKVFSTSNGITFSTPICFEDVFGYLCADFVSSGADLLINMTNDSWSGAVSAERQHMAMAVFRAVENRRSMLRGTNSGITCLILPSGKIAGEMEPFKKGWKMWNVPVYSSSVYGHTLYTQTKDASALFCVYTSYVLLAAGAVLAVCKKIKSRKNG